MNHFPIEPIVVRLNPELPHSVHAEQLGLTRNQWNEIRNRGWVSVGLIDRLAQAVDCHPIQLWEEQYLKFGEARLSGAQLRRRKEASEAQAISE